MSGVVWGEHARAREPASARRLLTEKSAIVKVPDCESIKSSQPRLTAAPGSPCKRCAAEGPGSSLSSSSSLSSPVVTESIALQPALSERLCESE